MLSVDLVRSQENLWSQLEPFPMAAFEQGRSARVP